MIRMTATLSIWSKLLNPDVISSLLGIEPENKVIKGIDRTPPEPKPDAHGWHMRSLRVGDDFLSGDVLEDLVARVKPLADKIMHLMQKDDEIDIRFTVHVASEDYEVPLPPDQNMSMLVKREIVKLIASLNATLDFEVFNGF